MQLQTEGLYVYQIVTFIMRMLVDTAWLGAVRTYH
jgi:hypothetical protein